MPTRERPSFNKNPSPNTVKILLIEDDLKTAAFLTQGFREQGFVADAADNGEDGLHLPTIGNYDVIVLDRLVVDRIVGRLRDIVRHHPAQLDDDGALRASGMSRA